MASFHMVSVDFWQDTEDWSSDERSMAIYLLTCPHRTKEGLFRLSPSYVVAELGFNRDRAFATFSALTSRGWIRYDHAAKVMFLCKSLRWFPPTGAKSIAGACSAVSHLRETPLFADFYAAAERWAPSFAEGLRERGLMPLPEFADAPSVVRDAPSEMGDADGASAVADGASRNGGPEQIISYPEQNQIAAAAREGASGPEWFDECLNEGMAKRLPWATSLETQAEQRSRCEALLASCPPQLVAGVKRDVLDAVRGGSVRKSLPEALRAFIGQAERRGEQPRKSPLAVAGGPSEAMVKKYEEFG